MFNRLLIPFFFIQLLMSFSSIAEAQIFTDKSIFYWSATTPPVKNISVRNSGDQALMVEVKVVEVINPGTVDEKVEPSEDILASPKRFSVAGKGNRTVRLLRRGEHGQKERVFRVSFVPQARDDDDVEQLSKSASPESLGGVLRVLSGVGVLVFTQPGVENAHLITERTENSVILRNDGNVNIALLKVQRCNKPQEECEDVQPKRLYPGNVFEINGTNGKTVFIRKRIGEQITEENIP